VVSFTSRSLYLRERAPGTHWIGGWVDPKAGLNDVEKIKFCTLPELELRPLGRPTSSQSLYLQSYPVTKIVCSPLKVNRHLGGAYRLHLQDWKLSQTRSQHAAYSDQVVCFLLACSLLLASEDGSSKFIRNVVKRLPDCTQSRKDKVKLPM
jgi:hypothetical protein